MNRWCAGILTLFSLGTAPLAAQDDGIPWRLSYFPYPELSPNDGLMGIARVLWFRQAPWGERITLQNSVALEAGYSTKDAWLARVTWANPRLGDGWRIVAHGEARRFPNADPYDIQSEELRWTRERQSAWVDVTRRITERVHLAVRPAVYHQTLSLSDGSFTSEISEADFAIRGALVIDLRDREYEVNNGALLEAGVVRGSGGDSRAYTVPYAHLRGWIRPTLPLRLTARFAWRGDDDTGALTPDMEFPGWEGDFTMLGGPRSHRGLPIGALAGEEVVFAGAEARLDILNVGELGAITVFGFVDGARVSEEAVVFPAGTTASRPPLPTNEWIWGPGGGVAIRVLRAAVLNVSVARAEGETRWYISNGWSW